MEQSNFGAAASVHDPFEMCSRLESNGFQDRLNRREVSPEAPAEPCDSVVVGSLVAIVIADAEAVGDLEEGALVLRQHHVRHVVPQHLEHIGEVADRRV